MFGLGFSEIVVIGVLALILLGPEQLPDLARTIGRFVNDLRRTTDGLKEEFRQASIHPSNLLEEIKKENDIHHEHSQLPLEGHQQTSNSEHMNPSEAPIYNPIPQNSVTASDAADTPDQAKKVSNEDGNG